MQVKPALRAYGQQVPKTVKTHIQKFGFISYLA